MAVVMALLAGSRVAGGYAGAIAVGSMVLALRGRSGAASFFPLRVCLCAPIWVLERSLSVYWALFQKLRSASEASRVSYADGRTSERVASGE